MYSARDNEGHLKVCLTLIFKVNFGGQVTYISHILIFQTSDMFKSTPALCLYHVYNPWWKRGHKKYLWPWFSRSFFEVKWQILINARSLASNTMKSTRRSSLYPIYNRKWRRSYNSQLDLDFEGQLSRSCD